MKKTVFLLLVGAGLITPFLFTITSCTSNNNPAPIHDTIYVHDTTNTHDTLSCTNCFGAVGCYPFNGNANDVSGNNLNGTVTRATLAADRKGNANSNSYHFSGYNSGNPAFIDLPNLSNFEASSGDISLSLWCKIDNVSQSPFLFTLSPDNPSDRFSGTYFWSAAYNYSPIWDHGNISSGRLISSAAVTPPATGTWCHLVYVRSKTGNFMKIYYNGNEIASKSSSTDISNKNLPVRIGGGGYEGGPLTGYFIGYIDDLKIFNKAVSASEVSTIYNAEK